MGSLMRGLSYGISRRGLAGTGLLMAAIALAGCSSAMPDFSQFKLPSTRSFLPQNSDTYVPPASAVAFRPVGPGDLVDGQGYCAGMAAPASAQGSDAGASAAPPPAAPGTIGLDMTECEVVRAIGPPQSVNLGSNERGDRKVVMTYMGSERAGTYEFNAGRLTALERGPEPPPAPKPEKPAKKKPAAATKRAPNPPPT
jgi:hypothetical protein